MVVSGVIMVLAPDQSLDPVHPVKQPEKQPDLQHVCQVLYE